MDRTEHGWPRSWPLTAGSEIGLALYGTLAIVTSLLMIVFSLGLWESRVRAAAGELLANGAIGALILVVLVIVFLMVVKPAI